MGRTPSSEYFSTLELNSVQYVINDMAIVDRKERERSSMKSQVIEAALELYLKDGIENVTIRNIADKIEYSPATIYLYFRDKDEIFYSLYNLAFGRFFSEQLKLAQVADPLERLYESGRLYLRWALENPKLYDIMFILDIPMNVIAEESCEDIGLRSFDVLKKIVAECIEQGKLKVKEIDLASMMLWNFTHGIVSLMIKKRVLYPPEVLEKITGAMLENFMLLMRK
jgi:AcrR family transcriptional regulator